MGRRKRRPGGGRKPGGEFPGKTRTFTTRIQPSTRHGLEQAAKARPDGSISAAAEYILKAGLQKPTGARRNRGLAQAVALLAEDIEKVTERSWQEDPFTADTLFNALVVLIAHFTPKLEKPTPPPAVERQAAKMPTPELAQQFRAPASLAGLIGFRLYTQIKDALPTEINEWTMPIFFSDSRESLALIASDLGLSREGKTK
jgi:hypothetical protein